MPDRNSLPTYLQRLLALVVLYYFSAKLSSILRPLGVNVSTLWFPAGPMVVFLFLWGRNLWPAVILGELALYIVAPTPLEGTIAFAIANTLHAYLAVVILERWFAFQPSLARLKDSVGLVLGAGVITSGLCALFGLGLRNLLLWQFIPERFFHSFITWWVADAISVVLLAPPLFLFLTKSPSQRLSDPTGRTEKILAWTALILTLSLVLAGPVREPVLILPVIIWFALKLGTRSTSVAVLLASGAFIWDATHPGGLFTQGVTNVDLISLNLYLGLIAGTGLILSSLSMERTQFEQGLIDLNATLEQRVAERTKSLQDALDNVKTLSGLLPICSHCKKVRNDSGYWQAVETFVSDHSEAEFSHGICPDCMEKHFPEVIVRQVQKREAEAKLRSTGPA